MDICIADGAYDRPGGITGTAETPLLLRSIWPASPMSDTQLGDVQEAIVAALAIQNRGVHAPTSRVLAYLVPGLHPQAVRLAVNYLATSAGGQRELELLMPLWNLASPAYVRDAVDDDLVGNLHLTLRDAAEPLSAREWLALLPLPVANSAFRLAVWRLLDQGVVEITAHRRFRSL